MKIRHRKYLEALFGRDLMRHNKKKFKVNCIELGRKVCKISVSCFNDTSCILDDGIGSLA